LQNAHQCDASGWYGEETLDVEATRSPAAGRSRNDVFAAIHGFDSGTADDINHGSRHEHLPWFGQPRDLGCDLDRHGAFVLTARVDLPDMEPGSHLQSELGCGVPDCLRTEDPESLGVRELCVGKAFHFDDLDTFSLKGLPEPTGSGRGVGAHRREGDQCRRITQPRAPLHRRCPQLGCEPQWSARQWDECRFEGTGQGEHPELID
jgi:hypothetical protein